MIVVSSAFEVVFSGIVVSGCVCRGLAEVCFFSYRLVLVDLFLVAPPILLILLPMMGLLAFLFLAERI